MSDSDKVAAARKSIQALRPEQTERGPTMSLEKLKETLEAMQDAIEDLDRRLPKN
ncbi:hypothetical protein SAMN04490244_101260 [Tranquillimonas rosea]|uniref:Uncharacterized protein n=1 Tax=Tranquillimonas rosea TaxID=641238 RepID=A0A1H9PML6_9RHOB|nr:hypothetical protein [Tranquillimonas rosea]SER49566.1 hypothetical protein SAMN04490244_101260 [Tranquillimonas rosea]